MAAASSPAARVERDERVAAPRGSVELGLIATPALTDRDVEQLAEEVDELLTQRYPDVRWEVSYLRGDLVEPPADVTELVDAARSRLLNEGWDLAVLVTDLPLRLARRPLLTHASPTHGVARVSLPALGVLHRARRLRDATADVVGALVGDLPRDGTDGRAPGRRRRARRRLIEMANDVDDPDRQGVSFLARVIGGNVRLLLGMIRANRPWRLAARLSHALVGALAAATYALVADDVWRIADSLDAPRLAALTLAAGTVAVVALIAVHDLWERTTDRRAREQVMLFNLTTVATLAIGIASLYLAVFVASLAGAALLIDSSLMGAAIGEPAHVSDYLRLAWLASSLATVGGAVGAALESDAAVREAAYAYRPEE